MKNKSLLFIWVIIALTLAGIIAWQLVFQSVNFYVTSAVMLLLAMLPLFLRFEQKKTTAREVTLIATLIALAVVGRAAFYLIPQVKPIAAIVIVSAVCLGAERGYIIGAFSAFVSNFLFGQGTWTPYQMFALGMVGFLAGLIFKNDNGVFDKNAGRSTKHYALRIKNYALALVGFFLAFAVYGLFVDISTILVTYGNKVTWQGILSVYAAGVPFSAVFGVSTAVFLFLFGDVFIRKINRIITKFDII